MPDTPNLIQLDSLQIVMPKTSSDVLAPFVSALQEKLPDFAITTPLREAHFIAQLAHESGGFKYQIENLNYSEDALKAVFGKYFPDDLAKDYARVPEKIANRVYASRIGNNDEASGDGWKYRGRGLIQLTGKANYQQCADSIGENIVEDPDLICNDPNVSVSVACWFWQSKKLNQLADDDKLEDITKRINGGLHGLASRQAYLTSCKNLLNIKQETE